MTYDTSIKAPSGGRPFLVINEDNDHYFKLSSDLMTRECLEAYVDDMAKGGHVTHVVFCTCGQRTSYDSKVWEPIWDGMEQPDFEGKTHNIWCVNAKKLFDAGIDPYEVWLRRCRERNISPWLAVRMNDVHNVNIPGYFRLTTHWSKHRELWRNPKAQPPCPWMECAYDYSKQEVQDYHFAIVKEQLDRYDPDGIELDWMRFGRHLTPSHEREQAPCLTEFMRRVRDYANQASRRLGHPVHVGVRVPTQYEVALNCGLDCETWSREKLVDLVVTTNFYASNDFDIDVEAWQNRLQALNPSILVLPCATDRISSSSDIINIPMDMEYFRAWGDVMYSHHAKGLYFFNAPYLEQHDEMYSEGMAPERLSNIRRRYPITWHDFYVMNDSYEIDKLMEDVQLPVDAADGNNFHIMFGNAASAKTTSVILGFDAAPAVDLSNLSVSVNGVEAVNARAFTPEKAFCGGSDACHFAVRLDVSASALRTGWNQLEVKPVGEKGKSNIVWCEILVE